MRVRPNPILLVAYLVLLALALPARAQTGLGAADTESIQSTIEQQIDAFKRDDATTAYSFAAPSIREIFPSADIFMHMVRQGYQPVYRPRFYAFDAISLIDGKIVQPVRVVGPDGVPVTAIYTMEQQPDGSWKIGGCVLTQEPGQGV